jgi:hypothetical protein
MRERERRHIYRKYLIYFLLERERRLPNLLLLLSPDCDWIEERDI